MSRVGESLCSTGFVGLGEATVVDEDDEESVGVEDGEVMLVVVG